MPAILSKLLTRQQHEETGHGYGSGENEPVILHLLVLMLLLSQDF